MGKKRMYDSVRWRKARAWYLYQHPLCALCERVGKDTPATVVDHIKPHCGDPALFWDASNWQPLCASCHSGIKRIQEHHGHSQSAGIDGMPLDSRHPWNKGEGG
jgi:5-methylcytosine-specific restriction endonuclease McrA